MLDSEKFRIKETATNSLESIRQSLLLDVQNFLRGNYKSVVIGLDGKRYKAVVTLQLEKIE